MPLSSLNLNYLYNKQIKREMEEMACNVLKIFDSKSENLINRYLLMQNVPYYGINCLTMG